MADKSVRLMTLSILCAGALGLALAGRTSQALLVLTSSFLLMMLACAFDAVEQVREQKAQEATYRRRIEAARGQNAHERRVCYECQGSGVESDERSACRDCGGLGWRV